jgi:pimeloyl-ACP methyl ester carboxylesterase
MFPIPQIGYTQSHEKLKYIYSSNSKKIACMLYNFENTDKNVIIYSHGNATDIGRMDSLISKLSRDLNIKIISYDYAGYGLSDGKATEQGCIESICAVYNYLLKEGYKSNNIILYGVSIGTGPTIDLAERVSLKNMKLKGILLQAPYTSAVGVVSSVIETSLNTCGSFVENLNPFRSVEKIGQVICPIIIIHGTYDTIISHSHSIKLKEAFEGKPSSTREAFEGKPSSTREANKSIELILIEGAGHNNIETNHYNIIIESIKKL